MAERLKVVQKFGTGLRNIDTAACTEKGVKVLTLRRRANISCAEHAFALILALARRLESTSGVVTLERIKAAGLALRPFDRRHTPGGNYARIGGTRALHGATIGIIGLGEIGREIALRAAAFGMRVLYHQRTLAPDPEERELKGRRTCLLATLLLECDWIIRSCQARPDHPQPARPRAISRIKPGACPRECGECPVIDRGALFEALRKPAALGGAALDVDEADAG